MKKLILIPLLSLAVLLGCATTQPRITQTPSGKPEAVFETADVDVVKSLIVNAMTTSGFSIQNDSKYLLSFTKEMKGVQGATAQVLIGNSYSTSPQEEAAFSIVQLDSRIRVVASASMSTQMAMGQVQRRDMTDTWFNNYQRLLLNLKQQFDVKAHDVELKQIRADNTGLVGILYNGVGEVVRLVDGGPAVKAGIRLNDRMLTIDGKPLANSTVEQSRQLSGAPGSKVTLVVRRGSQELTFEITRAERKEP